MTDEAEPSSVPELDVLLDTLRARVQERERQGLYPPDLVDRLEEHFRRIAEHRVVPDLDALRRHVAALDADPVFSVERIALESRVPGGQAFHAAVARAVSRQTQGILEQLQQFADGVRQSLHSVVAALEQPAGHVHPELLGQVDAVYERVAAFDRASRLTAAGGGAVAVTCVPDGTIEVVVPDLDAVPDGTLRSVAVSGLFEHLPAARAVDVLAAAHRKLAPGGHLVVATADGRGRALLAEAGFTDVRAEPGELHAVR